MDSTKNIIKISREDFIEKSLNAILEGDFINKVIEEAAKMGFTFSLMALPLVQEIETALFGEEENKDGE